MKHIGTARGVTASVVAALAATACPLGVAHAAAPAPTRTLVATSADGSAFDLDEYDPTDVTVQVKAGRKAVDVDDTQDLQYHWQITPFDTAVAPVRVPATGEDVQATDTLGNFTVALPAGQPSGSYVLVAGLGPKANNTGAIRRRSLLTVKAGQAAVAFADESPLLAAAGAEHPLTGGLDLEDGTGLPGRTLDLSFTRGSAGSDPEADAGIVETTGTAPVLASTVTTADDGSFATIVGDPAEDGQGTEVGGTLDAVTAATPDLGDAGSHGSLPVDFVSEQPVAGSALDFTNLGSARPGEPLGSTLTLTAPDDTFDTDPATPGVQGDADSAPDPVRDQVYTLSVDHGFFTTGSDVLPSVVGDPAGNLEELGQTLTGVTDAAGQVDFKVGIKRDTGFDDDGLVTATVTAVTGDLTQTEDAHWHSDEPLNGRLDLVLSPDSEQVAPVNPTLAGNRTYYEVNTTDQFGNLVADKPVNLDRSGDLDDYDYSDPFVMSDFDTAGDTWLVNFEAGDLTLLGTWQSAPTWTYTDTTGDAVAGTADANAAKTVSWYEIDFDASKFQLVPSSRETVGVGDLVTETVRVTDQQGNPVRGYRVRFFRFGPDVKSGDPVATRITNGKGEAAYSFIAPKRGTARVTATVTDGTNSRTLQNVVVIGYPVSSTLKALKGDRKHDQLLISAGQRPAGARVTLYSVLNGVRKSVGSDKLDRNGHAVITVVDRNGKRPTTYVALVHGTPTTGADTSNVVKLR